MATSPLNIYFLTFNCARALIDSAVFGTHLFDAFPRNQPPTQLPDLIVLSLQEIAPISHAFLGGSFLVPYFDAFRHALDIATKVAVADASYTDVVAANLGMTGLMVFARQDIAGSVAWVDTAGVGVGVHGMGNKGAVGARLGYSVSSDEEVELTFVAAHLAPAEGALEKRNQDWADIVRGLVFPARGASVSREEGAEEGESEALLTKRKGSGSIGVFAPTSYLVFGGDLNYRTSDNKPGLETHKSWPQPDMSAQDPNHYSQLLRNDQLTRERNAARTLHHLLEAPIHFPPTYKYADAPRPHVQNDEEIGRWDWAKHRYPSWCDRILYLDRPPWAKTLSEPQVCSYNALPLFATSDHRPVGLWLTIDAKAIPQPEAEQYQDDPRLNPPFALDMDWQSKRNMARRREFLVGLFAYLTLTWEGNALLLGSGVGIVGGWLVVRSFLAV